MKKRNDKEGHGDGVTPRHGENRVNNTAILLLVSVSPRRPVSVSCLASPFRLQNIWSGRRDLNSRPSPWQGDALPLSYSRFESFDSTYPPNVVKRALELPIANCQLTIGPILE